MINPAFATRTPVIPVSLFVSSARLLLEKHLGLHWISGEISNFTRAASGHCYFALKDERAQVRCVLFRNKGLLLDVPLRDGLQVEVRAIPTIYEARGDLQLNVEMIRLAGLGALFEKFVQLKAKLEGLGWFATERKRRLPVFPRSIGVVTSRHGAALRDVLVTLKRRFPGLRIILYPTPVQGEAAALMIANAIAIANQRREVEVLIVCRGGGSIEDLWPFNEEVVARALFESILPVVSGVGHETDFTICDFVADIRAATPTGAAALVVPDAKSLVDQLDALGKRWRQTMARQWESRMQRLDFLSQRLVHPKTRLIHQHERLCRAARCLIRAMSSQQVQLQRDVNAAHARLKRQLDHPAEIQRRRLEKLRNAWSQAGDWLIRSLAERINASAQSLRHLNPEAVLERGYSIVTDSAGRVVYDAEQLPPKGKIDVRLARGSIEAQVVRTKSAAD